MLGRISIYAKECRDELFIFGDFEIDQNLKTHCLRTGEILM